MDQLRYQTTPHRKQCQVPSADPRLPLPSPPPTNYLLLCFRSPFAMHYYLLSATRYPSNTIHHSSNAMCDPSNATRAVFATHKMLLAICYLLPAVHAHISILALATSLLFCHSPNVICNPSNATRQSLPAVRRARPVIGLVPPWCYSVIRHPPPCNTIDYPNHAKIGLIPCLAPLATPSPRYAA